MSPFKNEKRKNLSLSTSIRLAAAIGGVLVTGSAVLADDTFIESEPANLFGHFDQDATDNGASPANNGTFLITPNNPGVSAMGPAACAATSAVNSFIFLQNKYGLSGLYNPGNPYGTISTLAGPTYLNTAPATANAASQTGYSGGGVNPDPFRDGKEKYLQNIGPLTAPNGQPYAIQTVGQVDPAYGTAQAANGPYAGGVAAQIPTAQFIAQQLADGEDIEMFFTWNGTPGHVVALTGIDYDETTNSGNISFIDPTNSSGGQIQYGSGDAPEITSLSLEEINNHLQFTYQGGASNIDADDNPNDSATGIVVGVYAESPVQVPEPASMLMFAGAGTVLLRRRRAK